MAKPYVYEFSLANGEVVSILHVPNKLDTADLVGCLGDLEHEYLEEVYWVECTGRDTVDEFIGY